MEIVKAKASDISQVAALNHFVQNFHVQNRPDLFKDLSKGETESWLKPFIKDKLHHLFVAKEGEEIVGYVLLREEERPANPFQRVWRFLFLDHIQVSPKHQRKGIGKMLMDFVKDFCHKQRFDELVLDVWSFNHEATAFFESQGFNNLIERKGIKISL